MALIKESFFLTATNTDILAAPSRLAAIPSNGVLTIEVTALECDVTNFSEITLQLPGGAFPFQDLIVPANGFSITEIILHTETELVFVIPVEQGGHVLYQMTENGTNTFYSIVTLEF